MLGRRVGKGGILGGQKDSHAMSLSTEVSEESADYESSAVLLGRSREVAWEKEQNGWLPYTARSGKDSLPLVLFAHGPPHLYIESEVLNQFDAA